jgi:sucrose-6-phosphate hydrolase SacC (GH32 family)
MAVPVDGAARIADFGKDNYAGQWLYGQPEHEIPISIAWASSWQYTQVRISISMCWACLTKAGGPNRR